MKKFLTIAAVVLAAVVTHAQDISGVWQGTLSASGKDLRIVFRITSVDGTFRAVGYSIDQGSQAIPVSVTQEVCVLGQIRGVGGIRIPRPFQVTEPAPSVIVSAVIG